MKISKLTLLAALVAGLNLATVSVADHVETVSYDENGNYIPVITPTGNAVKGVAHGTGKILEGTGEIVTLQPGEGVRDIAEGTGEIVESAVTLPFNILSGN